MQLLVAEVDQKQDDPHQQTHRTQHVQHNVRILQIHSYST